MTFLRGAIGLPALVLALSVGTAAAGGSAFADDFIPYKDPYAKGTITLCNEDLESVTSGSISDLPYIWRAVGSEEAPPPYNDANRRAVLFAAQPRQGVDPADWTANQLTGASFYKDVAHPMAQSTGLDFPLRVYLKGFPPRWDGLTQLRLYYTTSNAPMSADYAQASIRVDGDTWTLLEGGSSDCGGPNDAVSNEVYLPDFKQRVKQVAKRFEPSASATPTASDDPSAQPSSSSTTKGNGGPNGSLYSPSPTVSNASDPSDSDGDSGTSPWVWLLVAIAVVAGVAGFVAYRRRSARPS